MFQRIFNELSTNFNESFTNFNECSTNFQRILNDSKFEIFEISHMEAPNTRRLAPAEGPGGRGGGAGAPSRPAAARPRPGAALQGRRPAWWGPDLAVKANRTRWGNSSNTWEKSTTSMKKTILSKSLWKPYKLKFIVFIVFRGCSQTLQKQI